MAVFGSGTVSQAAPHRACGFTLIEMMIVVGVIGILAAIAIPNYSDYVRRGKIIDGTSKLADARVHLEQWFLDRRTYVGACVDPPAGAVRVTPGSDDAFSLSCPVPPTPTQYTVQADGIPAKGMGGFTYTINERNVKTTLATYWTVTSPDCWVTRKDGTCG